MHRKICILIAVIAFVILSVSCAFGDVSLSSIPDANFRSFLSQWDSGWGVYDSDGNFHWIGQNDGILNSVNEISRMNRTIGVDQGYSIQSLQGIQLFDIENLYCENNCITELDTSGNPGLVFLGCHHNGMTMLNITGNPNLRYLYCDTNELTELNVSNNHSLQVLICMDNKLNGLDVSSNHDLRRLYCYNNYIEDLNLSNNHELTELICVNNPLCELDVSQNQKLELLRCGSNDLDVLDVTNNTLLREFEAWENHLTELDLSKNTALTKVLLGIQRVGGLKVKAVPEGYQVCMKDYVSDLENIVSIGYVRNGDTDTYTEISSFDKGTGIALYENNPEAICYFYNTNSPNNDLLCVVIKRSLNIATLERKGSETYGIICNMTENSYLNSSGNAITESDISGYTYSDYGKLGLAADGNSRLILRVQTDKPGTVSFSGHDDIGAKLESLSRAELSASDQLNTTEINSDIHQVSAVLVAPERFPKDKSFPSDSFKIHVKFTDEDGEITEDDLELKIEAAPVMLIHGLWGSAEKTFGSESGPGIWHQLKENDFTVGVCNYDGSKGPSEIIAGDYNRLYLRLWDMFDKYSERGIVCTKADIVAFGMGGLIAEKYLADEGKDSNDGNNWSVWSYKQGMVRRLITIATPYYGTPWADILLGTANVAKLYPGFSSTAFIADFMLSKLFGSSYISNLKNALSEMKTDRTPDIPDVPTHVIYGDVSYALNIAGNAVELLGDTAIEFGMGLFVTPWAAAAPVMCLVGLGLKFSSMAENTLMGVLFYNDAHDLVVGSFSAMAKPHFTDNTSTVYTGWSSIHDSLTKREDIRNRIAELLKGNIDSFTPHVTGNANHSLRSLPVSVRADSASDEARLTEGIKLNIYSKVSEAADNNSQTVTITAISAQAALDEMYIAIGDEESCCFFRLSSSDKTGKKFGGKLILTSQDIGAIRAFCFSHNPNDSEETSLLISNVAQISAASDEDENTPPEIIIATLTNAITNQPYNLQLTASGTTPLTWTRKGNLPAGLELSESGLISGTPTKAGKYTFTVTASNTYGESSQRFTLQVLDPVSITTSSLKAGTIGKSYSVTLRAKGSRTITWSAEGLPNGLTINEKGKISGKPTAYGKFTVKITAQNGAGSITENLQLEIKAIAPKLSGSLARPTLNEEYSSGLKVTGSDPIIWSITGTLPEGLTFDTSTGIISGTPASYAKSGYKLTITASNDAGIKSKNITLKVNGKAPKITAKLPQATAGENYSAEITASGSEPITFAADLPEFLTLNGNIIAGAVPESAKNFRIKIYASNPVRQNVSKIFTVKVSAHKSLPETQNTEKYIDDSETYSVIDGKSPNPENVNNTPDISGTGWQNFSGYIIVAELGEISCDMAEMYDFKIQLPDYVSEGDELIYAANSDEPSSDDEIAEFFDEDGEEITAVPASRKITVSIWLNPERTYKPVIAVKRQ